MAATCLTILHRPSQPAISGVAAIQTQGKVLRQLEIEISMHLVKHHIFSIQKNHILVTDVDRISAVLANFKITWEHVQQLAMATALLIPEWETPNPNVRSVAKSFLTLTLFRSMCWSVWTRRRWFTASFSLVQHFLLMSR
jgi:hypothetical protein